MLSTSCVPSLPPERSLLPTTSSEWGGGVVSSRAAQEVHQCSRSSPEPCARSLLVIFFVRLLGNENLSVFLFLAVFGYSLFFWLPPFLFPPLFFWPLQLSLVPSFTALL